MKLKILWPSKDAGENIFPFHFFFFKMKLITRWDVYNMFERAFSPVK